MAKISKDPKCACARTGTAMTRVNYHSENKCEWREPKKNHVTIYSTPQGDKSGIYKKFSDADALEMKPLYMPPMGVSQWMEHGKKNGYDLYFEQRWVETHSEGLMRKGAHDEEYRWLNAITNLLREYSYTLVDKRENGWDMLIKLKDRMYGKK